MTNKAIHRLACGLRNIPELADKTAEELRPLIEFWFHVGKENMSRAGWATVWKRWLYTWDGWSQSQVGPAWDAARELDTPAFRSEAEQSEHDGLFILRAICTHIQEHAPDGRWFLACRTAADVLASFGIEVTHMTASRWIKDLVAEGFLIKNSHRDPACPETNWYETAAAAARCEELDRQREQEQIPALVFAPINRLAQFLLQLPLPESVGSLADVFATAGRDEPGSSPSLIFSWRPLPVELRPFRSSTFGCHTGVVAGVEVGLQVC
jgi:hypothetical protein